MIKNKTKQKWTTDMCNTIDEVQKCYAEKKKPDTQKCLSCMISLLETQQQAKLIYDDRNQNNDCPWGIETV